MRRAISNNHSGRRLVAGGHSQTNMKTSFYLVVNDRGTTKTVKTRPNLAYNEVAIAVTLQLPNSLFQKPQLNASIVVPDEAVAPQTIQADMADNIREAIETATGLEVKLTIESPEE